MGEDDSCVEQGEEIGCPTSQSHVMIMFCYWGIS